MTRPHLLVRADASSEIGIGHVMRCLALAQAWGDREGEVTFACRELPESLLPRLYRERIDVTTVEAERGSVEDACRTAGLAAALASSAVVLDGYSFGAAYQQVVRSTGSCLVVVDDYGQIGSYEADIILDQNLGSEPGPYEGRDPNSLLLLGADYALLRRDVVQSRRPRDFRATADKVLVTCGGADPAGLTSRLLESLGRLKETLLDIRVVLGPATGGVPGNLPNGIPHRVEVLQAQESLAPLMSWADLAVAAAGSTVWELAYLGLPSLLISVAPNQRPAAAQLQRAGFAVDLGEVSDSELGERLLEAVRELIRDAGRRSAMSGAGERVVDGRGAARLTEAIFQRCER